MKHKAELLLGMIYAGAMSAACKPAMAQGAPVCGTNGYRVVVRRWDAVLQTTWELRQDCVHPEWPARSVAVASSAGKHDMASIARLQESVPALQPLLVRAGDPVRLWAEDATVHIEMTGVAEQSARRGEHITVRITRQTDDAGLTVQQIAGVVRAAGDVEMER